MNNPSNPIKPIAADLAAITKALERRPVLWIGAGLSIGAGYPSTWRTLEALVAAADDPIDTTRSFYEGVDDVVGSIGAGRVRDVLQSLFQPARPPSPVHRALARMAKAGRIDTIITTNYDDLVERSLAEEGAPYVLQPLEDNATVVGSGTRVLKVHGSYDDWQRVILSGRSYVSSGNSTHSCTLRWTSCCVSSRCSSSVAPSKILASSTGSRVSRISPPRG